MKNFKARLPGARPIRGGSWSGDEQVFGMGATESVEFCRLYEGFHNIGG